MPWTAAAIAGSGALGAGSSLLGSGKSSSAAKDSANAQLSMYDTTRSTLAPYTTAGQSAMGSALSLAQGSPTGGGPNYVTQAAQNMPGTMTQSQLEQTPGYQFQLNQGLKLTAAQNAARGLGVSGAEMKGAASYVTGLANSNYQQQFSNAQQNFSNYLSLNQSQQGNLTNQFNRLSGVASIGENAGAQTGAQGTQAAANYGNYNTQAGNASAAGVTGVSNAASSGVQNYLGYTTLQNLLNQNSGTGGASGYQQMTGYNNTGYAAAMTPGQSGVGGFVAPTSG